MASHHANSGSMFDQVSPAFAAIHSSLAHLPSESATYKLRHFPL